MRKIEQIKVLIEDQLKPSPGRTVKLIYDLKTDEQFFPVPVDDYFVNFVVKNRNNGNELSFTEEENFIKVNLGNMRNWPSKRGLSSIKHVKLEIEYTLLNPDFTDRRIRRLYDSAFHIDELIQPEFYITLPRGLRLINNGKKTTMLLIIDFENNSTLKNTMDNSGLRLIEIPDPNGRYQILNQRLSAYKIRYEGPYINKVDKKANYSYVISDRDNQVLREFNENLEEHNVYFGFLYGVDYDWHLFGTLIGLFTILFVFTLARVYFLSQGTDGTFTLPYLIAFLSYIALLLKYHDEDFNLPILIMIFLSMLLLLFWATCEFYCIPSISPEQLQSLSDQMNNLSRQMNNTMNQLILFKKSLAYLNLKP